MHNNLINGFIVTICFFLCNLKINAQDAHRMPANYVGALAGMEWNTISGMTGMEYERIIISRKNLSAGLKVSYLFPYETGNMKLFGTCCGDISSVVTALITADFFTSEESSQAGFFFHVALGVGGKKYEWDTERAILQVRPALEAGGGWLFPLGRQFAIKWTSTITFPSKEGGITFTRIAFGF
jgi:hypothetical protein